MSLLETITQVPPFKYVDSVRAISPESIEGTARYNLDDSRCRSSRLESWICIEMLAQIAEIHTRWLTRAARANGLLVGVDEFHFSGSRIIEAGELALKAFREEKIFTFLRYQGFVEHEDRVIAQGYLTIYNVGPEE